MFRAAIVYTIANGIIAATGLLLTLTLGRKIGPEGFGIWASFFAAQNIWAGLGFLRLETRLAACNSNYQANRIIYAGYIVGLLVSIFSATISLLITGWKSHIWIAILSGFYLAVFDVISQRKAYEGKQLAVLLARSIRILLPIVVATAAALAETTVNKIIYWHGFIVSIVAVIFWGKCIGLRYWWRLCASVVQKNRHGLLPAVIMSLLNGIWINGITPALNYFASPHLAGQFAMVQRLLGGALGLLSTAITLSLLKREFVEVHWETIRKLLIINMVISIIFCILMAIPLTSQAGRWLGGNWSVPSSIYWATSAFLVCSFGIGSISIVSIRLRDEWFLAIWQFTSLLCWVFIYMLLSSDYFLVPALWFGAAMYIFLGLRWRYLAKMRRGNV